DGQPVEQRPNEYDDTIYAVWKDGEGNYNVESYKSSVDAGVWTDQQRNDFKEKYGFELGDQKDGKFNGIVHMADGVYTDT
ncbi:hypothetical protein Q6272_32875, partial [Klebsiella pneumoniae]|uniref:hypothetical protein n=1 Tax=Klebsiella pneumoniae TaxID=573 RepID=UPI00273051E8